jgi:hypothetical protein
MNEIKITVDENLNVDAKSAHPTKSVNVCVRKVNFLKSREIDWK